MDNGIKAGEEGIRRWAIGNGQLAIGVEDLLSHKGRLVHAILICFGTEKGSDLLADMSILYNKTFSLAICIIYLITHLA